MAFSYLERFEDGDASDWTNLTATNISNLSGSWLGEVTSSNANVNANSPSLTSRSDDIHFEAEITAVTSDTASTDQVRYFAENANGNSLFSIDHVDDGTDLQVNDTSVGSWSADTAYTYRLDVDYGTDTFDLYRNESLITSDVSFFNSGQLDTFKIQNRTDSSGDSRSAYLDDLAYIIPVQNLAAVQGSNAGEIDTTWDSGEGEDSYNLYRAQSSGVTTGDTLVTEPASGTTSFTDTGLEDGEQFFYAISFEDYAGEYKLSNEDSAITILPQTNFDSVTNA